MGFLEAIVILIGVLFILGSFFVPEKLSDRDIDEIAKLSEAQLKVIVDKKLADANATIENTVDEAVAGTQDRAERLLEKESNEKIMAISEYSDSVLEAINKAHNEVMFLYSMLNDKYEEITACSRQINSWKSEMESFEQEMMSRLEIRAEELNRVEEIVDSMETEVISEEEQKNTVYHKDEILTLYQEGKNDVEIARNLGMGIGAVRLVIDLYKGECKDEV